MPTINIVDLQIKKAVVEVVIPDPYQETRNVLDANGDPVTETVTVTPLPYVQATIDYVLIDDTGNEVIRKGVAQFGPNSGLPEEQIIDDYIAPVLEEAIERATALFKVKEGLLTADALAGAPADTVPAGLVQ